MVAAELAYHQRLERDRFGLSCSDIDAERLQLVDLAGVVRLAVLHEQIVAFARAEHGDEVVRDLGWQRHDHPFAARKRDDLEGVPTFADADRARPLHVHFEASAHRDTLRRTRGGLDEHERVLRLEGGVAGDPDEEMLVAERNISGCTVDGGDELARRDELRRRIEAREDVERPELSSCDGVAKPRSARGSWRRRLVDGDERSVVRDVDRRRGPDTGDRAELAPVARDEEPLALRHQGHDVRTT